MKLNPQELAYVRSKGLYLTEKCDGCGKVLNQAHRWTIKDLPEVYCSEKCRDLAFFGDVPVLGSRNGRPKDLPAQKAQQHEDQQVSHALRPGIGRSRGILTVQAKEQPNEHQKPKEQR